MCIERIKATWCHKHKKALLVVLHDPPVLVNFLGRKQKAMWSTTKAVYAYEIKYLFLLIHTVSKNLSPNSAVGTWNKEKYLKMIN